MNLDILEGTYSFCRLPAEAKLPSSVYESRFFSISKTDQELSVICETKYGPSGAQEEKNWAIVRVEGPQAIELTGVIAALTVPLAEAKISIFAISTFDTDYLLIRNSHLKKAIMVLEAAGFTFF